jgi:hypothetical protein
VAQKIGLGEVDEGQICSFLQLHALSINKEKVTRITKSGTEVKRTSLISVSDHLVN